MLAFPVNLLTFEQRNYAFTVMFIARVRVCEVWSGEIALLFLLWYEP